MSHPWLSLCLTKASECAQSLHSSSASPKAGKCHSCTLPPSCSIVPVSSRMEFLQKFGALLFSFFMSGVLVFVAAAHGAPLEYLALEARRICVPEIHWIITIREIVLLKLSPTGHCTDSRLKHTRSLSVIEAYSLILELHPEGQALC